jgi:hypothetical protein
MRFQQPSSCCMYSIGAHEKPGQLAVSARHDVYSRRDDVLLGRWRTPRLSLAGRRHPCLLRSRRIRHGRPPSATASVRPLSAASTGEHDASMRTTQEAGQRSAAARHHRDREHRSQQAVEQRASPPRRLPPTGARGGDWRTRPRSATLVLSGPRCSQVTLISRIQAVFAHQPRPEQSVATVSQLVCHDLHNRDIEFNHRHRPQVNHTTRGSTLVGIECTTLGEPLQRHRRPPRPLSVGACSECDHLIVLAELLPALASIAPAPTRATRR